MSIAVAVKELRERTGAGILDCKKALEENAGDMELAIDWLRKKGIAAAAKKSDRNVSEGAVGFHIEGNKAVVVEVNSETDFVSRNERFQTLTDAICKVAINTDNLESLQSTKLANGRTVQEEITDSIAVIGENIRLRRMEVLKLQNKGVISAYVHNSIKPNLGKIAVLVGLESEASPESLLPLGKQIAMHIAAARPESLSIDKLDPAIIQRERDIFTEQAKASGKPMEVINSMIEGRIRKFYEESVLLEQVFMLDNKTKIKDLIKLAEKDYGATISLVNFKRLEVGEGMKQESSDFAGEVAALTKKTN